VTPAAPLHVGDTVRLRKPHPCGGRDWSVARAADDVVLDCLTCGRRILLPRDEFERRCVAHTPAIAPVPETRA
jgi:hypothetical protein